MSLKIIWDDKGAVFRPAVFCDHCGQEITEGSNGNFEWQITGEGMIYFTHKECCRAFENAHGGRSEWYCDGLDLLPLFMATNLKTDLEKVKEWARLRP